MVRVHVVLVPVQAPDQPANVLLASGVAVTCTLVPLENDAEAVEQDVPQSIPAGELTAVPFPVPALLNVKE